MILYSLLQIKGPNESPEIGEYLSKNTLLILTYIF